MPSVLYAGTEGGVFNMTLGSFRCKDLNGNGKADILWRHTLYEWLLNVTSVTGQGAAGRAVRDSLKRPQKCNQCSFIISREL